MSLDISGSDAVVKATAVTIVVTKDHPLIRLASALPWAVLVDLVLPDLKRTTARGCWWMENLQALASRKIVSGLQRPSNIKSRQGLPSPEVQELLQNRRAGFEALIGHTKHGGQLGRSRMKGDAATLAAGYASVLGFNLRQVITKQTASNAKAA